MKKSLSILLSVVLLLSCMLMAVPTAQAEKATEKRAIAIVYDNSGSMYWNENKAWCRATYAMEVFASMLNEGDVLQIYPMNPCTIGEGGTEVYSMENPLQITNAADASIIRENFIAVNGGTPIESIDAAAEGLKNVPNIKDEYKYLIIVTDGATFHEKNVDLGDKTKEELDKKIKKYAGDGMTVMYLGMDTVNPDGSITHACNPEPEIADPKYYVEKIAAESSDVLSALTEMCNIIFGRDTLPKNEKHYENDGKTIKLDVSTKKLIVFVQGANIDNLKITGDGIGKMDGNPQQVKYSDKGANIVDKDKYGNPRVWNIVSDPNLQGMMVTYDGSTIVEGSDKSIFNIEYTGDAKSIEVYYEPDVELAFIFTDADGNPVNPNALYEGDYVVSFGMMDAKTGKLVESDLLGKPSYKGSYTLKGEKKTFDHTGFSGRIDIPLKMNDTFEADLEVKYLSGYRIYKSSKDFGWPEGGITVQPKPIDDTGFKIEITGGAGSYPLQQLEEGKPYKAVVYFENEPLPAEYYNNPDKLSFTCDDANSNAKIQVTPKEGYYELKLLHKDSNAPQNTKCGESEAIIEVIYKPDGSEPATKRTKLKYTIEDDFATLGAELVIPEDYIVIKDMEETQAMTVKLSLNGAPLKPEEFDVVMKSLVVDCGGINCEWTPDETNSAVKIKLLETKGIDEGNYLISVNAQYTDSIGRVAKTNAESLITLSTMPIGVKILIGLLILLAIIIAIWVITHIPVLPTKLHTTKKLSSMYYDNEEVEGASFLAEIKNKSLKVQSKYGGNTYSIAVDVVPGKDSYLYKKQKNRSAEAEVASIRKYGPGTVQEITIGSFKYVADEETGKLVPSVPKAKPFKITNGMTVKFSGIVKDAGLDKDFEVISKLNFKK